VVSIPDTFEDYYFAKCHLQSGLDFMSSIATGGAQEPNSKEIIRCCSSNIVSVATVHRRRLQAPAVAAVRPHPANIYLHFAT